MKLGPGCLNPSGGMEPIELIYCEAEWRIETPVIDAERRLASVIGVTLNREIVDRLVELVRRLGVDPLGERGEHHALVVGSPLHEKRVAYEKLRVEEHGYYLVLRVL